MKKILPVIVISQFFCTSLWFAGNAISNDIARLFQLNPDYGAWLATAVQLGFIFGTLVFAMLSIADRFSPSKVFFYSALIAALFNLAISINGVEALTVLAFRFFTGFFLAGIYPVGMKIAADYYQQGLGKSLGWLLGALVLGTALPYLLKNVTAGHAGLFPPHDGSAWKYVIYATSGLAIAGGTVILLLVPDGPYRKPGQKPSLLAFMRGFANPQFRSAALGYFGHMWELYALWVFLPVILADYKLHVPRADFSISLVAFLIIASGAIACVLGGLISLKQGAKRVATTALLISCICCLLSPLAFSTHSTPLLFIFLFIWGMALPADSPMFSTLIAHNAPPASKGASLTIVNSIGFFITIVSIQLINTLINENNTRYIFTILAIGPVLGLIALISDKGVKNPERIIIQ
jgi:MFS family permease